MRNQRSNNPWGCLGWTVGWRPTFLLLCVMCSSPVTPMEEQIGDRTGPDERRRSIALGCAATGSVSRFTPR